MNLECFCYWLLKFPSKTTLWSNYWEEMPSALAKCYHYVHSRHRSLRARYTLFKACLLLVAINGAVPFCCVMLPTGFLGLFVIQIVKEKTCRNETGMFRWLIPEIIPLKRFAWLLKCTFQFVAKYRLLSLNDWFSMFKFYMFNPSTTESLGKCKIIWVQNVSKNSKFPHAIHHSATRAMLRRYPLLIC